MKLLFAALSAATVLTAQAAPDGRAMAAKYNCLACHQVDKKVVGPAFRDVAVKYRGDKKAESRLIEKVKKGGVGVWGQIPMPAQQISDADLKVIMQWVLSQK
ncbi:c-type cytochrome [Chitinimonas arctica]|uniref:C-type cytochrome n=1 Tax=Chitinimonas arctica TaxID=2594795 RepID=A0A516SFP9_9NEIS|nr:c-type cytochrome [Chitinimonas arctica]QDQ26973.1 c-type cytochrome [Chitinimonas arctica]